MFTAVEDLSLVSETILVLPEREGEDLPFDKVESSVQPFEFPDEVDTFFTVTITESQDEIEVRFVH